MVLTDRQRNDLHAGIHEYLLSRPGDAFQKAAAAIAEADPDACEPQHIPNAKSNFKTPMLEKKWTAIPRLQKKVMELERASALNAKTLAHRTGATDASGGGPRRLIPRLPCSHTLEGHAAVVTSVAVHPVFCVVVSGSEDGTIKVWDHESGDYIRTLKGHTNTVTNLAFTPKGTHLASSSTDLSIKLWDFNTYTCVRTLRGHDHTISAVQFIPADLEVSSADTMSSTTTGLDAGKAGCSNLLSASRDHTVKLWHVESGFCDHTFTNHSDWVRCLAVRQCDGGLWASSGNDATIFVYDKNKKNVAELRGHEHVVESIAFIIEESFPKKPPKKHVEQFKDMLASGGRDRSVRLWKISTAECLHIFTAHENWVRDVIIHPNGNYILSCGDDRSIRVFDIKAKRCLRSLDKAHNHFVSSISMHHTLPILVSGGVDQAVRCWLLD